MEVIDDFVPSNDFRILQANLMRHKGFPWYYNYDCLVEKGDGKSQFVHTFYNNTDTRNGTNSDFYFLLDSCQDKLGVKELLRIKANLRPATIFGRGSRYHTDVPELGPHKTAILYMNTCNGYTKFKKGGRVRSVANRIAIFDSDLDHAGVACSDEKVRVVINFNYISK